jgi:CheY-like chemotaxis protein
MSAPAPPVRGVLVLDDDDVLLDMLAETLPAFGYDVWTASDGGEAVRLYREHRGRIDVVVLDIQVPGMDGPATLRELRRLDPAVRAVFMTWDTAGQENAFVVKPFHPADVARKLRLLLEHA